MLTSMKHINLDFNASTQDVILALGDPDEIYYKADDRLSIHKQEVRTSRYDSDSRALIYPAEFRNQHRWITFTTTSGLAWIFSLTELPTL